MAHHFAVYERDEDGKHLIVIIHDADVPPGAENVADHDDYYYAWEDARKRHSKQPGARITDRVPAKALEIDLS